MKSLHVLAAFATAVMLVGCNQNNPPVGEQPAAAAPDVNVNVPPAAAPDVNITTPPADAPDVNIQNNPPPAEGAPPPAQ